MKRGFFILFACILSVVAFSNSSFAFWTCVHRVSDAEDNLTGTCFPPEIIVRMVEECGGNVSDYRISYDVDPEYWESEKNQTDPCNSTISSPYASGYE